MQPSDDLLLENAKLRNKAAYDDLANRHSQSFLAVARRYIRDEARAGEVVNKALYHGWTKIGQCNSTFEGWMKSSVARRAQRASKKDAKRRKRERDYMRAQQGACRHNGHPIETCAASQDEWGDHDGNTNNASKLSSPATQGLARVKRFAEKCSEIECVDMTGREPASIALEELVQEDGEEVTPVNKRKMKKRILQTVRDHKLDRRAFLAAGATAIAGFRQVTLGPDLPYLRVDPAGLAQRIGEVYSALRMIHWRGTAEDVRAAVDMMPLARQVLQVCLNVDLSELDRSKRALVGKFMARMAGDLRTIVGPQALSECDRAYVFAMGCANYLNDSDKLPVRSKLHSRHGASVRKPGTAQIT